VSFDVIRREHLQAHEHALHFDLVLISFLLQEFGIHYLSASLNHSHFLLKAFYFQSASPFSCPPCLEYLRLRALILLRLWC